MSLIPAAAEPYVIYVKIFAILGLAAVSAAGGFYVGNLRGNEKAAVAKTAQEGQSEAIAQADVKGLEGQAEHQAAQQAVDNKAEATHEQDVHDADTAPPRTDPVFVQSGAAAKGVCVPTVSGTKAQANADGANTSKGGTGAGGGGSVDRRPEIEALKERLERISADYRELVAEWPQ